MNITTKTIIDLVNRLKSEGLEELKAELDGCATPFCQAEFCDWHAKIDDLDLSRSSTGERSRLSGSKIAQLRALLHRVVDVTKRIGGRAVNIGKIIIKWLFAMIERYPSTVAATLAMSVLAYAAAHAPYVHAILFPIVMAVAIGLVGYIFIKESIQHVRLESTNNR